MFSMIKKCRRITDEYVCMYHIDPAPSVRNSVLVDDAKVCISVYCRARAHPSLSRRSRSPYPGDPHRPDKQNKW